MNLPNRLTLLRIILTPIFIVCFYLPTEYAYVIAATVFFIAFMTDILDGSIARKRGLVTDFGKLIDPIADKLLSSSALIMLASLQLISPLVAIIVISREFIVSALRQVSVEKGVVIAANWIGKAKTVLHCIGVISILVWEPLLTFIGNIIKFPLTVLIEFPFPIIVIWISVALTVWSGIDYVARNIKHINFN